MAKKPRIEWRFYLVFALEANDEMNKNELSQFTPGLSEITK